MRRRRRGCHAVNGAGEESRMHRVSKESEHPNQKRRAAETNSLFPATRAEISLSFIITRSYMRNYELLPMEPKGPGPRPNRPSRGNGGWGGEVTACSAGEARVASDASSTRWNSCIVGSELVHADDPASPGVALDPSPSATAFDFALFFFILLRVAHIHSSPGAPFGVCFSLAS